MLFGEELVLTPLMCECARGDVPGEKVLPFAREGEVCVPTGDRYGGEPIGPKSFVTLFIERRGTVGVTGTSVAPAFDKSASGVRGSSDVLSGRYTSCEEDDGR